MRYAAIMAGGAGTRLWPMSTKEVPKQLIPFISGRSLMEIAADRLDGLVDEPNRLICTGESHREVIKRSLPKFGDDQILGEPIGRDTLNAVGFTAAVVAKQDPDAVMAIFTADHVIEPINTFQERVRIAYEVAERVPNALVTFGITPTHPATGYGYVHVNQPLAGFENVRRVEAFKEKPDEVTAKRYLEHGRYLWNSGMFVWKASTLLDCIKRYRPDTHAGLMKIADAWGTDQQQAVLEQVYPTLEKISVDYAVLEPAGRDENVSLVTVEMPVRWLDVGSWPSYGETLKPDNDGNRTSAEKAIFMDTTNTLIVSDDDDHLVATIGLSDIVIVKTGKATLICHKDVAQRIKDMHAQVADRFGDEYL